MKKSEKTRECYLDIDPYRGKVYIVLGSFEQADKRLRKIFNCPAPDDLKDAWGATWRLRNEKTGVNCSVLWIDTTHEKTHDNVCHEVFHLTHLVLERAGIKLNDDTPEAYAYLNGWLNSKILSFVFLKLKEGGKT